MVLVLILWMVFRSQKSQPAKKTQIQAKKYPQK